MAASSTRPGAEVEAAYFDELVASEGEFNPFTDAGWMVLQRRFVELVQPRHNLRILDIGCGTGQSRQLYADYISEYTGIDLAEGALAKARTRFPDDTWLCADARDLPFEPGSFDLVAFSSVLHHIDDFENALREAHRVLVPGGSVFAFDPNLLHPAMALFRYPKSPLYSSKGVSPNEAPLLPRRLRAGFERAGFQNIRQRAQSDIAYREVAPRLLNAGLKLYNFADHWFERIGLGRWFGVFVLTAATKE
ncbi:MAG TPA: class I SAM-dependent methyltransferase [Kofleriaceae bacterium]